MFDVTLYLTAVAPLLIRAKMLLPYLLIRKAGFSMKKIKQILAIAGVIILLCLYAATLICALSRSESFMNLLMASVYATVVIPVLLWAYSFIYKLLKKQTETEDEHT